MCFRVEYSCSLKSVHVSRTCSPSYSSRYEASQISLSFGSRVLCLVSVGSCSDLRPLADT